MANDFVQIDVTTDAQQLADDAIARLQASWPGWDPNDADLEVIQIETLADMAQDAINALSQMGAAAFRAYGAKLLGTTYLTGVPATGQVQFTMVDTAIHTIPAGTAVAIDNVIFVTTADLTTSGTLTPAPVTVQATDSGVDANGLTGGVTEMITSLAFVANVTTVGVTTGGTDAEDDAAYTSRLVRALLLQAKTLVTGRDYELMALDNPNVARASATVGTARNVTVVLVGLDGNPVSAATKTAVAASFDDYRQVNTTVTLADPTYTTVNVTYSVHLYPGYSAADAIARINAVLTDVLSPATWGSPSAFGSGRQPTDWFNEPVVRQNKLIDLIASVEGVDYVASVAITGSAGTVTNGDLTMPGTFPLPLPGVFTGSTV